MAKAAAAESGDSPGLLRSVELRAQGFSARNIDAGQNIRASLRLKLERPWTASSVDTSQREEANAAELTYEAERAESKATACDESMRGRAALSRAELGKGYRGDLERVLAWISAWRAAGTLDPITGARIDLLASRRLLAADVTASAYRIDELSTPLPDAEAAPTGILDVDPSHLRAERFDQHPAVRAHRALARQHDSLASAESHTRIPWFDFVGVDYGIDSDGLRDLAARFSVEVPIDDGASGRSAKESALRASEEYEAQSEVAELERVTLAAVRALAAFEADVPRMRDVGTRATETLALATRMLGQRTDSPDRVLQLLTEVYEVRTAVLDAQERAGRAACALEYATGKPYGAWPRLAPAAP